MGLTEETKKAISGSESSKPELSEEQKFIKSLFGHLDAAHIVNGDLGNTFPSLEDPHIIVASEEDRKRASCFGLVAEDGLWSILPHDNFNNKILEDGDSMTPMNRDDIAEVTLEGGSRDEFLEHLQKIYNKHCPDLAQDCGLDMIINDYMNGGTGPVAEPEGLVMGE